MAAYFEKGSPAMAQLAAIVNRLEQMVDHAGLANLFYALEVVCSARVAWRWCGVGVGWAGQKWLATLLSTLSEGGPAQGNLRHSTALALTTSWPWS